MTNAKKYFDNHPTADKFHFTSDGLCFHKKYHADAHSNVLKDKKVVTITREQIMAKSDNEEVNEEVNNEETKKNLKTKK